MINSESNTSVRDRFYIFRRKGKNYVRNVLISIFTPLLFDSLQKIVVGKQYREEKILNPCLVLLYHRVTDLSSDPQMLCVKPDHFEKQLSFLAANYKVLKVEEFTYHLKNKINFPENSVLLTFDDGYADNFLEALPLLEKHKMQALFYISTGTLNTDQEYWWDAVERIVLTPDQNPSQPFFEMDGRSYKIQDLTNDCRTKLYESLLLDMKVMRSESRELKIKELALLFGKTEGRRSHRAMTFDELKKMDHSPSAVIGAHTHLHCSLAAQTAEDQYKEIQTSKRILEKHLEKPINHFSYPFGGVVHYNQDSLAIVKELKFETVAANTQEVCTARSDRFQFPRFLVRDWVEEEFEQKLLEFISKKT